MMTEGWSGVTKGCETDGHDGSGDSKRSAEGPTFDANANQLINQPDQSMKVFRMCTGSELRVMEKQSWLFWQLA